MTEQFHKGGGSAFGVSRRATILKYNKDGSVVIAINEAGLSQPKLEFTTSMPIAWTDPKGGFLGGQPEVGTTVQVQQEQGGSWTITSFIQNDTPNFLAPGRLTAYVRDGHKMLLDPNNGFYTGKEESFFNLDGNINLSTTNIKSNYKFTDAERNISSTIKRDLSETTNKAFLNNTLFGSGYEKSLFEIGFDPTISTNILNTNNTLRNPALVENRTITYESAPEYFFGSYAEENELYTDLSKTPTPLSSNSKRNNRTDAMSVSLEFPNYLMEEIKGTAVDIFGNILDLNRNILPIGKLEELSLKNNKKKDVAFQNIQRQIRKSIAYHWELNARKELDATFDAPDVSLSDNYSRDRSRFQFDIDKEGQFKINIPASSETGNIALNVRAENYSTLVSKTNQGVGSNDFAKSDNNQDIFLDSFAPLNNIIIKSGDDDLDGYSSPVDRLTGVPIKAGTVFHDITNICSEFTVDANYLKAGLDLINFDKNNRLNRLWKPIESLISDEIIVNGDNANAGGRSGTLNLDGSLTYSIGANTIDRQSVIGDYAGGIVHSVGRDRNQLSYVGNFDGGILIQSGGSGISNKYDSRFKEQNDSYINGSIEIRCLANGQMHIFRMAEEGISLISAGTITLSAQQDIVMRSNANIYFQAENAAFYPEIGARVVKRYPSSTTIG